MMRFGALVLVMSLHGTACLPKLELDDADGSAGTGGGAGAGGGNAGNGGDPEDPERDPPGGDAGADSKDTPDGGTDSDADTPANDPVLALDSLRVPSSRGFVIEGSAVGDNAGYSVDMAGDVNGDGLGDIIVGAPHSFESGPGYAYVLFGRRDTLTLSLGALDLDGFVISGTGGGRLGVAVAGAGDVNGDGLDDLVVGEPSAGGGVGAAYVIFGKGDTAAIELSAIEATGAGFIVSGSAQNVDAGRAVDGAGDVNGDGLDDIIVCAFGVANAPGAVSVVFGKATTSAVSLGALGTDGYRIEGASLGFGVSASAAGDVNADGLDDIIIGDSLGAEAGGSAYVIFGSSATGEAGLELLDENPPRGFALLPADPLGNLGISVAGAGDVDGDGDDDVVIGVSFAKPLLSEDRTGLAYAVYGKPDGDDVSLLQVEQYSSGGFAIFGTDTGDLAGGAVSGGGDFNGDGFSDIVVGAEAAALGRGSVAGCENRGDCTPGMAYVIWGQPFGSGRAPVTESLADLEAGADLGLAMHGANIADHTGRSVASGSDINGDGFDDILIGAPGAYYFGQAGEPVRPGRVYVLFGSDMRDLAERLGEAAPIIGTSADDTLIYDTAIRIDGGNGVDTIQPNGTGYWSIEREGPSAVADQEYFVRYLALRASSIEHIDLSLAAGSIVYLDDESIRRLPQSRPGLPFGLAKSLIITGSSEDTVSADLNLAEYEFMGMNETRRVYKRIGAFYGLEVSSEIVLQAP
jgi:hypothetical protein